jgi:lipopolysaccharide export system protein LptA
LTGTMPYALCFMPSSILNPSRLRACYFRVSLVAFVLTAALVLPSLGTAASRDTDRPIHVKADTAELDEVTGVGVYRGDVRITQGTMVLTADTVTVIAPNRRVQKLIADSGDDGDKSAFRHIARGGDVLIAKARYMEYEPDQDRITLLKDAVLRKAADRFAAERIVYYIDRQVIDAGDTQGGERVEMTLVPRTK